jgi:pimeloyl-ACP methyl ester carboxylesterase
MTAGAERPPSSFTLEAAHAFYREQWPSLDDASLDRLVGNSLIRGEDGLYSNRYDRRLADIATKAAIPEIDFLWDALTRIQCPTLVTRGDHSPILETKRNAWSPALTTAGCPGYGAISGGRRVRLVPAPPTTRCCRRNTEHASLLTCARIAQH